MAQCLVFAGKLIFAASRNLKHTKTLLQDKHDKAQLPLKSVLNCLIGRLIDYLIHC